jgi:hypothetical protein
MSNSKFLRSYSKPQATAWDDPVFRSPLEWYIEHTTYPSIIRAIGDHDIWYKIRFRLNSNNFLTEDPYFWLQIGMANSVLELEFNRAGSTTEIQEQFYSYFDSAGTSNPDAFIYGTDTFPTWPVNGQYTFGPLSGSTTPFVIFPNLFDRINELVIEQTRVSGSTTINYYFGEASGSGPLPLVRTVSADAPMLSDPDYSTYIYFQIISAFNDPFETMESGFSFDVFQTEYYTGSIPSGALFANSLVQAPSGWGTDFSEFENIEDLINQVRPGTTTFVDKAVFYQGASGYYAPIFYWGPYEFQWLAGSGFAPPSAAEVYSEVNGYYFFDRAKFDTLDTLGVYQPADGILENPYLVLMPTGSRGDVGKMMGPLSVGGSIIPPVIDPEVRINLSSVILKYSTVRAPSTRRGLYLQRSSGSPQISLEPVWPTSSWHLPGDIWFSDTTGSWRGLFYADYSSSFNTGSAISSSVVPYKIFATTGSRDYLDGGSW